MILLTITSFRRVMLSGVGRLPSTIRDPFKSTSFIRLDNVDEEILGPDSSHGQPTDLADADLANSTLTTFCVNFFSTARVR